jgi:hypothetical protein
MTVMLFINTADNISNERNKGDSGVRVCNLPVN